MRLYQRGNERHGVVGKRRRAQGVLSVARAVAAGERAEARGVGCREPAALRGRIGKDARIVPQAGADQLDAPRIHAIRRENLDRRGHGVSPVRNENRVRLPRCGSDALHRLFHLGAIEWIALHRNDASAASREIHSRFSPPM